MSSSNQPATLLLATCLILGSGCTTVGSDFSPVTVDDEGKALVYLYYECDPSSNEYYVGGTVGPKFQLNRKFIGYLSPDSYIPLVLPEGSTEMGLLPTWNYTFIPKLKFSYVANGADVKYLRFGFSGTSKSYYVTEWSSFVEEVEPEIGRNEIKACQLNQAALQRARAAGFAQ